MLIGSVEEEDDDGSSGSSIKMECAVIALLLAVSCYRLID